MKKITIDVSDELYEKIENHVKAESFIRGNDFSITDAVSISLEAKYKTIKYRPICENEILVGFEVDNIRNGLTSTICVGQDKKITFAKSPTDISYVKTDEFCPSCEKQKIYQDDNFKICCACDWNTGE